MSTAQSDDASSIAILVQKCLEGFHDACSKLAKADPSIRSKLTPGVVHDSLGRFRLWVGNIGAHRRGKASLDYKLREASHIRIRVLELLQNLESVLHEALEIITGKRVPWEDLSDSDSDVSEDDSEQSKDELPTELAQLVSNMAEINSCLMRLSLAIRNPAPHDQFKESSQIDVAHFEIFDVDHVRGKFPQAADYLVLRLGKAISRRRQYLRYREDHRRKLEQGLKPQPQLQELTAPLQAAHTVTAPSEKIESTVASSIPLAIRTSASAADLDEDGYYEDTLSQTSYASSNNDPSRLYPPTLPEAGQDGEPFECPLCFRFTSVRQEKAWHKHVYRDLQPYVCTFEECKIPDRTYESRHEWFQHELQAHRKWWECIEGCNVVFRSLHAFHEHLTNEHDVLADNDRTVDLVRNCERQESMNTGADCELCSTKLSTLTQLRRHLGKHHEELSLFALPSHMKEDDNEAEEGHVENGSTSSVAGSDDSLSSERVTCGQCGLRFGDDHENRQAALSLHMETIHVNQRSLISSVEGTDPRFIAARELLRQKPSVAQALDQQIFDQTLIHHDLRLQLPDFVNTWLQLKYWVASNISDFEHEQVEVLQAIQFQTMVATQELELAEEHSIKDEVPTENRVLETDTSPHVAVMPAGAEPVEGNSILSKGNLINEGQKTWQCTFCHGHLLPELWRHHEETQHSPKYLNGPRNKERWACGFCGESLTTWDMRQTHIANHFSNGLTMASWQSFRTVEDYSTPEDLPVTSLENNSIPISPSMQDDEAPVSLSSSTQDADTIPAMPEFGTPRTEAQFDGVVNLSPAIWASVQLFRDTLTFWDPTEYGKYKYPWRVQYTELRKVSLHEDHVHMEGFLEAPDLQPELKDFTMTFRDQGEASSICAELTRAIERHTVSSKDAELVLEDPSSQSPADVSRPGSTTKDIDHGPTLQYQDIKVSGLPKVAGTSSEGTVVTLKFEDRRLWFLLQTSSLPRLRMKNIHRESIQRIGPVIHITGQVETYPRGSSEYLMWRYRDVRLEARDIDQAKNVYAALLTGHVELTEKSGLEDDLAAPSSQLDARDSRAMPEYNTSSPVAPGAPRMSTLRFEDIPPRVESETLGITIDANETPHIADHVQSDNSVSAMTELTGLGVITRPEIGISDGDLDSESDSGSENPTTSTEQPLFSCNIRVYYSDQGRLNNLNESLLVEAKFFLFPMCYQVDLGAHRKSWNHGWTDCVELCGSSIAIVAYSHTHFIKTASQHDADAIAAGFREVGVEVRLVQNLRSQPNSEDERDDTIEGVEEDKHKSIGRESADPTIPRGYFDSLYNGMTAFPFDQQPSDDIVTQRFAEYMTDIYGWLPENSQKRWQTYSCQRQWVLLRALQTDTLDLSHRRGRAGNDTAYSATPATITEITSGREESDAYEPKRESEQEPEQSPWKAPDIVTSTTDADLVQQPTTEIESKDVLRVRLIWTWGELNFNTWLHLDRPGEVSYSPIERIIEKQGGTIDRATTSLVLSPDRHLKSDSQACLQSFDEKTLKTSWKYTVRWLKQNKILRPEPPHVYGTFITGPPHEAFKDPMERFLFLNAMTTMRRLGDDDEEGQLHQLASQKVQTHIAQEGIPKGQTPAHYQASLATGSLQTLQQQQHIDRLPETLEEQANSPISMQNRPLHSGREKSESVVLFVAKSILDYDIRYTHPRSGHPFLSPFRGERFAVIGQENDFWLARSQDRDTDTIGWIMAENFQRISDIEASLDDEASQGQASSEEFAKLNNGNDALLHEVRSDKSTVTIEQEQQQFAGSPFHKSPPTTSAEEREQKGEFDKIPRVSCPYNCDSIFTGKHAVGNLTRHLNHRSCPNSRRRILPFACPIHGCDRKYARSDSLKVHMRRRHGAPPTESSNTPSEQEEPEVLFQATSLSDQHIVDFRYEGGIPFLTYASGETFDVIGTKDELWLARNQNDVTRTVGWIPEKQFACLLPDDVENATTSAHWQLVSRPPSAQASHVTSVITSEELKDVVNTLNLPDLTPIQVSGKTSLLDDNIGHNDRTPITALQQPIRAYAKTDPEVDQLLETLVERADSPSFKENYPQPACTHSFNIIRSDTALVQWNCNICHAGPYNFVYECQHCKLKTCRSCASKAH